MTEYKVGDKVKFVNEVGGGTVVELIDKYMVKVRTSDDWDLPALRSELMLVEPAPEKPAQKISKAPLPSTEKKEEPEVEALPIEKEDVPVAFTIPEKAEIKDDPRLVLFSLVPENSKDPLNSPLEAYLINDSDYLVLYNYVIVFDGMTISREAGILEEGTKCFIESYPREQLNNLNEVLVQLIFYKTGQYIPHPPVEKRIKLDARKFYKEGSFKANEYFDEPAQMITVYDSLNEKLEQISAEEIKAVISKQNDLAPKKLILKKDQAENDQEMIVDLHIHELIDNHAGMSNAEILEIQMKHFRKAMDEAIQKHIKKLILVHGVGQGTLKQDIRMELEKDFKSFEFQDASFKEYGYGATLVLIRQNFRPRRRR